MIARESGCKAVAVVMTAGDGLCRARNLARTNHRRVSDERMERMLAAMEPVARDEGFAAVFRDDEVTVQEIFKCLQEGITEESHEYCNQAW